MVAYPKIVFGDVVLDRDIIQSASVTEEFSPLSITVPIGRLDVQLYSEDKDLAIVNPSGKFEPLVHRHPVAVYEIIDGRQIYIGQYYLEDWENLSNNTISLSFMDEIGLLDSLVYKGGIWLTPITVGNLLKDVFSGIDTQYECDPDLAEEELSGWIPICSYREAIQQIAFASGAYVLAARQEGYLKFGKLEPAISVTRGIRCGVASTGQSRVYKKRWRKTQWFVFTSSNAVTRGIRCGVPNAGQSRIYKKRWRESQWGKLDPLITIPASEQGIERSLGLRSQVTGVEVTFHDIVEGTGEINLYDGELPAGKHEITFSQPMHTLSVTGATISSSGANFAILTVPSAGAVTLTGKVYEDTQTEYGVYMSLASNVKENVLKVTDATLVNYTNGVLLTRRLYDYFQQRYVQKMKLIAPLIKPGGSVILETLYGRSVKGVVEKMNSDLAGGFITQTEVVGIVD